jgi:uncharacterized protein (TIGR03000 family)
MVYKYFLFPAVLCASFLCANAAQAQKGGGHGGGGAAHGAYHGGAYHNGAYHNGYYHNGHYHYGYGGPVIGIGIGLGGYYGGPYGYGYPYAYPYDYPVVVPGAAYYPAPIAVGQVAPSNPQPAAAASNAANVRVLVPDGQAKVWFDGTLTTQTGTDRSFHTPSLNGPGSYRIRAAWMANGKEVVQEFVAPVTPGQTSTVDFTRPASEPLPAPKKD